MMKKNDTEVKVEEEKTEDEEGFHEPERPLT